VVVNGRGRGWGKVCGRVGGTCLHEQDSVASVAAVDKHVVHQVQAASTLNEAGGGGSLGTSAEDATQEVPSGLLSRTQGETQQAGRSLLVAVQPDPALVGGLYLTCNTQNCQIESIGERK